MTVVSFTQLRSHTLRERFRRIKALIRHKISFMKVEKKLYGKISMRSITHDLDKLFFYFMPVSIKWNRKRHKIVARHHNPKTYMDFREQFVDWECARFTKTKSILTGIEWCHQKRQLGHTDNYDYSVQQGIIFELRTRLGSPLDWYE